MNPIPSTLTPAELADLDVSELYDLGLWPPQRDFAVQFNVSGVVRVSATNVHEAAQNASTQIQDTLARLCRTDPAEVRVEIASVDGAARSGGGP